MTVNYVYLGYGTTDENGECKLDHDANGDSISHSYTGTGAGKIDVVASLDSPSSISDSSLVSETYEVYDCIFHDEMGTNTWHKTNQTLVIESTNDGIKLTNDSTTSNYYAVPKINNSNISLDSSNDYVIEMDFELNTEKTNDYFAQMGIIGKNVHLTPLFTNSEINVFKHIKVTVINKQLKVYINGVYNSSLDQTITNNSGDVSVGLHGGSVTVKNFKIYPI